MNVLKAVTTALSMLSVKIFLEDTVVNVRQDMKEMERLVHVCYPAQNNTYTDLFSIALMSMIMIIQSPGRSSLELVSLSDWS